MPMACGNTVAPPARATPCRASFHQSYAGRPRRSIAGESFCICAAFSSSVIRDTRAAARSSKLSEVSSHGRASSSWAWTAGSATSSASAQPRASMRRRRPCTLVLAGAWRTVPLLACMTRSSLVFGIGWCGVPASALLDPRVRAEGGADEAARHVGAEDGAVGVLYQPGDALAVAGVETEAVAALVALDVQGQQLDLLRRLAGHDLDLATGLLLQKHFHALVAATAHAQEVPVVVALERGQARGHAGGRQLHRGAGLEHQVLLAARVEGHVGLGVQALGQRPDRQPARARAA